MKLRCGHDAATVECGDGIDRAIVHQAMTLDETLGATLPTIAWCAECGWVRVTDAEAERLITSSSEKGRAT